MKLLIGWYHLGTERFVDISDFDTITDTDGWYPAVVDVPAERFLRFFQHPQEA